MAKAELLVDVNVRECSFCGSTSDSIVFLGCCPVCLKCYRHLTSAETKRALTVQQTAKR